MTGAEPRLNLGTLLGIWAHPDDETFLSAGLMMSQLARGNRVVCVTATRGEAGSADPDRWPAGEKLAALRTAELSVALATLGRIEHHWLDYPDGGCDAIPDREAVAAILLIAAEVAPDTIVTFASNGMTGHSDHQAVSRWATRVTNELAVRPRLLHAVYSLEWLERYGQPLRDFGVFMDSEPDSAPEAATVTIKLSSPERDDKLDALISQVSQTETLFATLGAKWLWAALGQESFVQVNDQQFVEVPK